MSLFVVLLLKMRSNVFSLAFVVFLLVATLHSVQNGGVDLVNHFGHCSPLMVLLSNAQRTVLERLLLQWTSMPFFLLSVLLLVLRKGFLVLPHLGFGYFSSEHLVVELEWVFVSQLVVELFARLNNVRLFSSVVLLVVPVRHRDLLESCLVLHSGVLLLDQSPHWRGVLLLRTVVVVLTHHFVEVFSSLLLLSVLVELHHHLVKFLIQFFGVFVQL